MRQLTVPMMMKAAAPTILVFTLAACGGNGGGNGSNIVYSGATTPADVTTSNALALASTAYDGGNSGGSLALVGMVENRTDGSMAGASQALTFSRVLTDAVRTANLSASPAPNVVTGATASGSLPAGNCGDRHLIAGAPTRQLEQFTRPFGSTPGVATA